MRRCSLRAHRRAPKHDVNDVVAYIALFLLTTVFGLIGISSLLAFLKDRRIATFVLGTVTLAMGATAGYFAINRPAIQREQSRIDTFIDAASNGDINTVRTMLAAHPELANVEQVASLKSRFGGARGQTMFVVNRPLRAAAEKLHADVVALLLDHGADANGKISSGETALHAVGAGYPKDPNGVRVKIIDLLIAHGANVNAITTRSKRTPLHENAKDAKAVADLIAHGADVNARDDGGRTPLLHASIGPMDSSESVKILLDHGADIVARDNSGDTAFLHAATSGNVRVMETLLSRDATAKASNNDGDTALHKFVSYNYLAGLRSYDTLALLCSCGLSPAARNRNGKTPVDLIRDLERGESDATRRKQFEQEINFLSHCDRFVKATKEQRKFLVAQMSCEDKVEDGCARLAWCYDTGSGVAVDRTRAAALYKPACDAGADWTCYNLGILYEAGDGVPQDNATAINYYRKACDAGDPDGCKKAKTR